MHLLDCGWRTRRPSIRPLSHGRSPLSGMAWGQRRMDASHALEGLPYLVDMLAWSSTTAAARVSVQAATLGVYMVHTTTYHAVCYAMYVCYPHPDPNAPRRLFLCMCSGCEGFFPALIGGSDADPVLWTKTSPIEGCLRAVAAAPSPPHQPGICTSSS